MAKQDTKRIQIFDLYSANLHLLNDNGLITKQVLKYEKTYICPICLDQFSIDDLDIKKANYLTLEDVPPKSLGGKANLLTCKKCNNTAGHAIDNHLSARLKEMDNRKFLPGTELKVRFSQDNKVVQGEIKVEMDGTMKAFNSYKNNKRENLDNYIKGISPKTGNPILNMEVIGPKIDFKRLQVGILKTAYLLAFEKFGYEVILDLSFDPVREQIKNPDKDIYPMQFWFVGPFTKSNEGVHIVTNDGLECFMAIFSLTSRTTKTFGAILPLKTNPIIEVVAGFHASIALDVNYGAEFLRLDSATGYINDLNSIKDLDYAVKKIRAKK